MGSERLGRIVVVTARGLVPKLVRSDRPHMVGGRGQVSKRVFTWLLAGARNAIRWTPF